MQEVAGVREGEKEAIGERDKLREFGFEKLEAPKVMVLLLNESTCLDLESDQDQDLCSNTKTSFIFYHAPSRKSPLGLKCECITGFPHTWLRRGG